MAISFKSKSVGGDTLDTLLRPYHTPADQSSTTIPGYLACTRQTDRASTGTLAFDVCCACVWLNGGQYPSV